MSEPTPTPSKKHKKSRDTNGEKSSKKRKHHDTDTTEAEPTPSKLLRTTRESLRTHRSPSPNPLTSQYPLAGGLSEPTQPTSKTKPDPPFTTSTTPFFTQTTSFYLALSPIGQRNPLEGLCAEHLSPLVLTYYPPLKGVVLSYSHPRLSEQRPPGAADKQPILSRAIEEYAVTYVWLTAAFTILRPARGAEIEGHVTVQSPNHLGLVCWNLFNASIERRRLPRNWRWQSRRGARASSETSRREGSAAPGQDDGEGYFVDGEGKKVEGMVRFRLRDFDIAPEMGKEKGFTSIEGTMLDDEEEGKIMKESSGSVTARRINRRLPGVDSVAVNA